MLKSGIRKPLILWQAARRGIDSEILSGTGISNVEHNKGSVKDY